MKTAKLITQIIVTVIAIIMFSLFYISVSSYKSCVTCTKNLSNGHLIGVLFLCSNINEIDLGLHAIPFTNERLQQIIRSL